MVATQKTIKGWIYDPLLPLDESKFHGKADIEISKRTILKNGLKGNYTSIEDDLAKKSVDGESVYCFIEGCGYYKVISISKSDKFIYFEKTTSTPSKNHIFYSFQSDNPESTEFLQNFIQKIVDTINNKYKSLINEKNIKLKRAHQPGDGSTNIAEQIKKQIQQSMLFIADLTPLEISKTIGNYSNGDASQKDQSKIKHLYNPNVCLELGYALLAKKPEQIVILCPLFKIPNDHRDFEELKKGVIPFDIASYHRIIGEDLNIFIREATKNIVAQIIKMHGYTSENLDTIIEDIIDICLREFGENQTK